MHDNQGNTAMFASNRNSKFCQPVISNSQERERLIAGGRLVGEDMSSDTMALVSPKNRELRGRLHRRPVAEVRGERRAKHEQRNPGTRRTITRHRQVVQEHLRALMHSHLRPGGGVKMSSGAARSRRAEEDVSDNKIAQCQQLYQCALGMSKFDLTVWFYSDDISESGTLDSTIVTFNEGGIENILEIYDDVKNLATDLQATWSDSVGLDTATITSYSNTGGTVSQKCDALLQEFHRTVEHQDVPEWQGARVAP